MLIESVLPELKLEGAELDGVNDETSTIRFKYGTLSMANSQKGTDKSLNVFLQPVRPIQANIETFMAPVEFRQSNRSRDFVDGDDEHSEMSYIKLGCVLHEVFSRIRTTADINQELSRLQSEGILYNDELSREKIIGFLRKRLESPHIAKWFSPRWQLYNECSIMRIDDEGHLVERRPDRVMTDGGETHVVDFKFGRPHPDYLQQVQEYMQLLIKMGMPQVRGWLWYVYSNKILEVKL
jgi:hypothetical protein